MPEGGDARSRRLTAFGAASLAVLLALACGGDSATDDAAEEVPRATVDVAPLLELPKDGGRLALAPRAPARSSRGFVAAVEDDAPGGAIALFDASGEYVRSVGRRRYPDTSLTYVTGMGFGPGDSLWVVDALHRMHLFSPPPAGAYVRTVPLALPLAGTPTPEGIVARALMTGDGLLPPRLVGWDGRERARFGPVRPSASADNEMGPVATAGAGRLWRARSQEYAIELLARDGAVVRRIDRRLRWFRPDSVQPGGPRDVRPVPRITDLQVGDDGALWVLIRRAHRDWSPSRGGARAARNGPPAPLDAAAMDSLYEGVIEVLDAESGRPLARGEVPGRVLGFVGPGIVYAAEARENGQGALALLRLGIRR